MPRRDRTHCRKKFPIKFIAIFLGLSSIEPNDDSGQVDRGEEIFGCLVVACDYCPVLRELTEEALHQVVCLVHLPVKGALYVSIAPGWDHKLFSCCRRGSITRSSVWKALRTRSIGLASSTIGVCEKPASLHHMAILPGPASVAPSGGIVVFPEWNSPT
jgi:hypothetical protein